MLYWQHRRQRLKWTLFTQGSCGNPTHKNRADSLQQEQTSWNPWQVYEFIIFLVFFLSSCLEPVLRPRDHGERRVEAQIWKQRKLCFWAELVGPISCPLLGSTLWDRQSSNSSKIQILCRHGRLVVDSKDWPLRTRNTILEISEKTDSQE